MATVKHLWKRYLEWRRAENVAPAAAIDVSVLKADISDADLNQQSLALSTHMEIGG